MKADRKIYGELHSPESMARQLINGEIGEFVQVEFEYSRHQAYVIMEELVKALKTTMMSDQKITIYVKTYNDIVNRVPDELFMAIDTGDDPPQKLLWTREELQSDFPAGDPPAFSLNRYTFEDGNWEYNTIDYKEEFGWDDYE